MNLLKMLFGSRKPALNKPVVSGSLQNPNFGIDNPIVKGEINTGGIGYKALEIKEPVVVGYKALEIKEPVVVGYYCGIDNPIVKGEINTGGIGYKALEIKEPVVVGYKALEIKEPVVVGYYCGNRDANGNDR